MDDEGRDTSERRNLEAAIAAQEELRGRVPDAIVDASIAVLREKLEALGGEPAPERHRKLVTIMFVDIVGSTRMVRDLDPEENLEIMDTALKRLSAPIEGYGGRVTRFMGDGFVAVFGDPVAHETDAEMAVRAGLEVLAISQEYAAELVNRRGIVDFDIRIGVHTGQVIIGGYSEAADTIMGSAINLAARIEQAALPGYLLISQTTYRHVQELFDTEPLEPVWAKGFQDPVPVYLVLGARPRAFHRVDFGVEGVRTRMIGRERQLTRLQEALHRCVEGRHLRAITVIGEAGVGKSRLIYEFETWLESLDFEVRQFKGRAYLETQDMPFALMRDIFANEFRIQDDDRAEVVREKMSRGVESALEGDADARMKAHFIGQVLGFDFSASPFVREALSDPAQLRGRAMAYLADYARATTSGTVTVLLLEDIHWADASSLETLGLLAQILPDQPLLIVALARPDLDTTHPKWGEGIPSHGRMVLEPLSPKDTERLVNEILQRVDEVPQRLRDLVTANAEGNPYFVEEMIKVLIEDGVVVKGDPKWAVRRERLDSVRLPSTLMGVLQARLDSLTTREHVIVQQASVVGRVFWDALLCHINQASERQLDDDEIHAGLDDLQTREMIFPRKSSAFANTRERLFKHIILREVAYESVLISLRHLYHGLVADWLVEQSGERVREYVGLIADHLHRAGRDHEAATYLYTAGEQAAAQFANDEALEYFRRALALAPEDDRALRFDVLLARDHIHDLQGKREAQARDIERLEALAGRVEGSPSSRAVRMAKAMQRKSKYLEGLGRFPEAGAAAEATVRWARQGGDAEMEAAGRVRWAVALWRLGQYEEAREQAEETLALSEEFDLPLYWAHARVQMGNYHWFEGDYASAADAYRVALNVYRKLEYARGVGAVLLNLALVSLHLGELDQAQSYAEEGLEQFRRMENVKEQAHTTTTFAQVARMRGKYALALEQLEAALPLVRGIGDRNNESILLGVLGDVYVDLGDWESAGRHFDRSLALARELGNRRSECLTRLRAGYLAALQGDLEACERAVRDASEINETLGLDSVRARIEAVKGNLRLEQGRHEEAEAAFAEAVEIYRRSGERRPELEALAGAARIRLAQDDAARALAQIEPILAHLSAGKSLDGAEEALRIHLTVVQALQAAGDVRWRDFLDDAHRLLETRAGEIDDPDLRESFLRRVPWNRELTSLYERRVRGPA